MSQDERIRQEAKETTQLEHELLRLGIDFPRHREFWWDDMEDQNGSIDEIEAATNYYLTPKGKATARKLIREEKRKNAEWWVRIVGSIIALITNIVLRDLDWNSGSFTARCLRINDLRWFRLRRTIIGGDKDEGVSSSEKAH